MSDQDVFGGEQIVGYMRLSVERVLNLGAQGVTPTGILDDDPRWEPKDIRGFIA